MNSIENKNKYLKYKTKYFNLLNKLKILKGEDKNILNKSKILKGGDINLSYDISIDFVLYDINFEIEPYCIIKLFNGDYAIGYNNIYIFSYDTIHTFNNNRTYKKILLIDNEEYIINDMIQLTDTNIVYINSKKNEICLCDINGNLINKFDTKNININSVAHEIQFIKIIQMYDRVIYISDVFNKCIHTFTNNGDYINTFNGGILNFIPQGISKLGEKIMVSDKFNKQIVVFTPLGEVIRTFTTQLYNGNYEPYNVFQIKNYICVSIKNISTNVLENYIEIFNIDGTYIKRINVQNIILDQSFICSNINKLNDDSIALINVSEQIIYLLDIINPIINLENRLNDEYEFDSKFQCKINGIKFEPVIIRALTTGDIIITANDNAYGFDILGNYKFSFDFQTNEHLILSVKEFSDIIYMICICDNNENKIFKFDLMGNFISEVLLLDNRGIHMKIEPMDIIKLSNGFFAIISGLEKCVKLYDQRMIFVKNIGSKGISDGKFRNPLLLLELADGNIMVSDNLNNRIQIFDIMGTFIGKFGKKGSLNGEFNEISDIIQLDNENIVVCDSKNNCIQIFDKYGEYLTKFGKKGTGDGEFNYSPLGITQLSDGRLAVSDYENKRIQIFKNISLIESISIKTFYEKLNYTAYIPQEPIQIIYIEINNEKIFNYEITYKDKTPDVEQNYTINNNQLIIQNNIFDTIYFNRNILFLPNSLPFFIFYNANINKRDIAIDSGGLTRTVFYELSKYLGKNNKYFIQDPDTKLYKIKTMITTDKEKIIKYKKELSFLGELIGFLIKIKEHLDINLEPMILYQLSNDVNIDILSEQDIIKIIKDLDSNLINTTPYICYNKEIVQCIEKYNGICLYDDNTGNTVNIQQLAKLTTSRIKEYLKESEEFIKAFVEGFRIQIDINKTKLNKLPLKLLDELICGKNIINYDIFISNIKFVGFNNINKEILLEIIKNNCNTNNEQKYLEILLIVMTGYNKIPSIGYSVHSPLRFEIKNLEYLPIEVHSCFNQLIINSKLFDDYKKIIDKKQSELYNIFTIESLKKIQQDFSRA